MHERNQDSMSRSAGIRQHKNGRLPSPTVDTFIYFRMYRSKSGFFLISKQIRRQVPLSAVRRKGEHPRGRRERFRRLNGEERRSGGGSADQYSFLARQPPSHLL